MTRVRALALGLFAALLPAGCGGPPPVHPITGKVTYKGKAYKRLLVYFRPASGDVNQYGTNMGVGETDADGNLAVKSTGGAGVQTGEYRVTFALYQETKTGKAQPGGEKSDKPDEAGIVTKQVIARPFDDETSQADTPQRFTVRRGENTFTFDIP